LVRIKKLAENRPDISPATLSKVYYYHGRLCQETNQPKGAVKNLERALKLWQRSTEEKKTSDEIYSAIVYENLGMSCIGAQRFDEARTALQKAIDIARQPGAPCANVLGDFMQCLAACHLHEGNIDAAEEMVRCALLEQCGANNENRGGALYTLGNVCLRQEKYDEALQLHQEVLRIYTDDLGHSHHWVADSCHKVGCILAMPQFVNRDLAEAE
jgi:tetratricopeptide (TPR) repeat protein